MSLEITEPGIYPGLDEQVYHADPVPETSLSASGAKSILDCPARFRHRREHPVEKKAFNFGKAAHAKVLGIGSEVVAVPAELLSSDGGVRSNDAKAWVAQARERGAVVLKPDEVAVVDAMAAKLLEHPLARRLLADGEPETSLFHRDPDTLVMLRARLDWRARWHDGRPVIVDYKTTGRTADPGRFGYEARDYGYHMQDPWYRELADALFDEPHLFLFVVQETSAPYLVTVCELDDDARAVGAQRNRVARRTYLECMTRGEWPAYPPIVHPVSLPFAALAPEPTTEGEAA